jgi:tetratricopeptide (TPR) repeat protein
MPGIRTIFRPLCLTAVLLGSTSLLFGEVQAYAQTDSSASFSYGQCMNLASTAAEDGVDYAKRWAAEDNTGAALHCEATSYLNLGRFAESAEIVIKLANTQPTGQEARKAALYGQAGQIWEQAGDLDKAAATYKLSLDIDPSNAQVWKNRAIAFARQKKWKDVIANLDYAHAVDYRNVDTLVLRATAYRYVEEWQRADNDISRALRLDPISVAAILERGNIKSARGNLDGALEDWTKVTALGLGTPQADIAKRNIAKLNEAQ